MGTSPAISYGGTTQKNMGGDDAEECYEVLQMMFEDADTDNNSILDAQELTTLLTSLHRECPVTVAYKADDAMARDGTQVVLDAIATLDVEKVGGLNFTQFTQMLGIVPWNSLLPTPVMEYIQAASVMREDEAADDHSIEAKALVQRQLVSDISKEAVLRDTAHIHSGLTFEAFNKVKQLEGQVRKYYSSYAERVTGNESFEFIVAQCGREPVVRDLLQKLSKAKQSAAKGAADLKSLNAHVKECTNQRAIQSQKLEDLDIPVAEEEEINDRVQEMIAFEKSLREAQPQDKSAVAEMEELEQLSVAARENYMTSAHNRRAGYLWPSCGNYKPELRQAELQQLARTSQAFQREGGVRGAVRFMTDHPYNQHSGVSQGHMAQCGAANHRMADIHMNSLAPMRETACSEAEALPVVGSDIKSVFVTQSEMPTTYNFAISRRQGAKPGMPMPPSMSPYVPLGVTLQ